MSLAPRSRQFVQYKFVLLDPVSPKNDEIILNKMAREGWTVTCPVTSEGTTTYLLMERKVL